MKITMPQPVAEIKYGGYASGNELVWTKGAGLQFLPAGTKLYAASVHAPTPVAYLDVGAGGYMYLGTDLTEDQVGSFPWGRHTLAIVGTYGADGYVPAEWPFDYAEAYQVAQQDLAIWKRRALEAELRVRDQDQIIDRMGDDLNAINGPTFMGEPLLPKQSAAPAASDVGQLLNDLFEFFESSGIDPGNGIALRLASALTTPQPSAPAPVERVETDKRIDMWGRIHDLAVSKGYDHVLYAVECAPVYKCDCMGARKVALDLDGNTMPCECVTAANDTTPQPSPSSAAPDVAGLVEALERVDMTRDERLRAGSLSASHWDNAVVACIEVVEKHFAAHHQREEQPHDSE